MNLISGLGLTGRVRRIVGYNKAHLNQTNIGTIPADGFTAPETSLAADAGTTSGGGGGGGSPPGTKPAYLGTTTDPDTGLTITRITGDVGDSVPTVGGAWPTIAYHNYSKDQPWSADEAYIVLKQVSNEWGAGSYLFLDGTTYAPLFTSTGGTSGGGEKRWHPTVADQMITLNSNGRVVWWNPVTNTTTVKVAAVLGYTAHEMGPNEGNPTYDGSKLVAKAVRSSDSHVVARLINIDAGTVGVVIDMTAAGLVDLDWVSISPLGTYVVAEGDFGLGRSDTRKVWNASTGALVQTITNYGGQHIDLGVDASGNEVLFSVTGSSPYSHGAFMQRLSDGAATGLSPTGISSFNWHVSTRPNLRTGVLSVNDSLGFTYDGMLVGVHLGTPNVVTPYCHHYSNNIDYDSAPKACMSPSGTRVLFASNWGDASGRPMQTYVVDV
jgi:hypothetical protein